jgi:hypothetical protein
MANEFIIREGLDSKKSIIITGSLTVTNGITGSLNTASYGLTASYAVNALTASLTQNILSASYVVNTTSASYASQALSVTGYTPSTYSPSNITSSYSLLIGDLGYITPVFSCMFNHGILSNTNKALAANTIWLSPIHINRTGTVSRMGVACAGATTGTSGSIRLGIYTNSNAMLPDQLLFDGGLNGALITPAANTSRLFYEAPVTNGPVLYAGEIYWFAMMVGGNPANISFLTMNNAAGFVATSQNRVFNPLLGVGIPINENALRNIAYYRYGVGSAGTSSFTSSLPQTSSAYTSSLYGTNDGITGTIPLGPFTLLTY